MARVTLQEIGGGRQLVLDDARRRMFERELKLIKQERPPRHGYPLRIAPGMEIIVEHGTHRTRYLLYDRAVILQESTKRRWQFYFGLLLHEWLYV
jgi:hypothetical protein